MLYSRQFYHGYLSNEDDGHDQQQSLAALEMEGAASRLEGPGTEEIEEMGHHEDGEEERLLVAGQSVGRSEAHVEQVHEARDAGVLEDIEQHKEQDEEAAAHTQDIFIHRAGEDEGLAVSRLVPHHALRGRQRSQSHGGKGVHDEVHP